MKIHFLADEYKETSRTARENLSALYGQCALNDADILIPLGGDGMMLAALQQAGGRLVYGMVPPHNNSTGFTLNSYKEDGLEEAICQARKFEITPLRVEFNQTAGDKDISRVIHAFSTASVVKDSAQAASFELTHAAGGDINTLCVGGDGIAFSTPLGSTGLNFSAGGPVLDLDSRQIVLTGLNLFRPRTLTSLVLPCAETQFRIAWDDEQGKRPLRVEIDGRAYSDITGSVITIRPEENARHHACIGLDREKASLFSRLKRL